MKTIDAIRLTLSSHSAEFTRGRALQPALSPYENPNAVLEALAFSSPLTAAERDAVTLALIAEHQRARRPMWQSILLAGYEPMLCGVWKRLFDKKDAESRLVLAFIESIAEIAVSSPPSLLALHLRHAVERRAFGSTAASNIAPEMVSLSAARTERSPEAPDARILVNDEMRRLEEELTLLFSEEAPLVRDVLIHARTGRLLLEAFIEERFADQSSRARAALYQRLERQRRQALAHLERRFGLASFSSVFLAA